MIDLKKLEVWFVTGSQQLYGNEVLQKVDEHSRQIALALSQAPALPVQVVFKPVVTTADAIHELVLDANASRTCIGIITWMHTFSPAKMWIAGLAALQKPLLHLHTQFNRDIPWGTIDMDFMNLNQSAHGDREYGFMVSRLRIERKVVAGHWQDPEVLSEIAVWERAAAALHDSRSMKIARFGDNMREVAVTEGDKVEAQVRFGYSVGGFGIGDLTDAVSAVTDAEADRLMAEYEERYTMARNLRAGGNQRDALRSAAKIELGMRAFLQDGGFQAFTTCFQDLHGMTQLPGLAVQRLMADGYGFGAEGDWKTAALLRSMKVMAAGLPGGTSFMEDYTYHLNGKGMKVLGAHMLEVCESIADGKPSLEIHPLSIGGKGDPARLVFSAAPGPAINGTIIDMGDRFRMVVNEVDAVAPDEPLPKLPVARAVWVPRPSLKVAAAAWILAGGAHHAGYSQAITAGHLRDFAEMTHTEFVLIGEDTTIPSFKNELRWNAAYYRLAREL